MRKGKVGPFAKLKRNTEVQKAFQVLTEDSKNEKSHQVLLKYTACLYSAKENSEVTLNAHRYKYFEKVYKPNIRDKRKTEGH